MALNFWQNPKKKKNVRATGNHQQGQPTVGPWSHFEYKFVARMFHSKMSVQIHLTSLKRTFKRFDLPILKILNGVEWKCWIRLADAQGISWGTRTQAAGVRRTLSSLRHPLYSLRLRRSWASSHLSKSYRSSNFLKFCLHLSLNIIYNLQYYLNYSIDYSIYFSL